MGHDSPLESATLKSIAEKAGVSIGTVDRVLHGRGRVSTDTEKRVRALLASSGYRPNIFASRLSAGSKRVIAVMMPHPDSDPGYWRQCETGLHEAAEAWKPMKISVVTAFFDRGTPRSCNEAFAALNAQHPAAWVMTPVSDSLFHPLVAALPETSPLVFLDSAFRTDRPHTLIAQDAEQGGRLAARLMALVSPPGSCLLAVDFANDDEHLRTRTRAFTEYARGLGREVLAFQHDLTDDGARRRERAARSLANLRRRGAVPGSLFVPNAYVGDYAGLGIPLAGYDLIPRNQELLETGAIDFLLHQGPRTMARTAVELLARHLLFDETLPAQVPQPLDVVMKENLAAHQSARLEEVARGLPLDPVSGVVL